MLMRSCPPLQILEEFGLGKLDVQEFLFVEEHLLSCEDCIFRLKHLTLTDPIIETLRDQWSNPAFTITSEVHPIQRHLHALFEQITIPVTLQNTASIAFLASEKSKSVSKQIKASAERMGIQLPEKVAHYQLKE
ncbi:MAG TPA: hypothetical protein PKD72_04305, partial [Gemmatales bacterium]|nr:hypothetical protein [Gemmatales bacterium]